MENVEEKEFKSFFKDVSDGNESRRCNYTTRLDTYGCGCKHDCRYCYAKSLLSFRGLWKPNSPAVADINEIRKTIKRELGPHEIVRLGGMTDCFQPAERDHRVTLATIKELNKAGVGYLIVTKNKLVAEDEYTKEMDPRLAHIQVSITTTDSGISRRYEPGASLPEERIAAAELLQHLGFDTSVRLSPFSRQDVEGAIFQNLAEVRARTPNYVFSMRRRGNSWGISRYEFSSEYQRRYRDKLKEARDYYRAQDLTPKEKAERLGRVNVNLYHTMMKELAKKYGFIYTRTKVK